jgi:hypothetical protein
MGSVSIKDLTKNLVLDSILIFFRERKENDKKKIFFFFVSFFKGKKILPLTHLNIFLFVRKHTHIVNRIKDDVEREREDLYCVWYYYEEVVVRK